MRRRRSAAAGVFWLAAAVASASPSRSPTPNPAAPAIGVLTVGVYEEPPWAMKAADGGWRGLSVDLWKWMAEDLNVQYRFVEAGPNAILEAVSEGRMDLAAGPFAATMERQRILDFTHTYIDASVGIAARRSSERDRWLAVVEALSTPTAIRLYVGVVLLAFLAGTLVWLLERRHNPMFSGRGARGAGSGFWWAWVTTVGVGYGDKVPVTFVGRLIGLVWMFVSLILITSLTAFVTAKLAFAQFGQISGLSSLHNAVSGAVKGSAATELLRRDQIPHRLYDSAPQALEALLAGDVRAVVYGTAALRYLADRDPQKRIEVLPAAVERTGLAFPLPDGSALRTPLNESLRGIMDQPRWQDLQDLYFATQVRPDVP
jgi:ABC-type amino acid transport substrate-binding protein